MRAPRAPSTEALVLSAPFDANVGPSLPSISLIISLAKYFSLKNYWAKDIIFLVSDEGLVGTQAWLNAYHDVGPNGVLVHEPLSGTSGPIQAAVNLEIDSRLISLIDVKIEGLNGQLPNLDLFNVAVELCTRESLTPTFHGTSHPYAGPEVDVWKQYARTIFSMMRSQLMGSPTGAHGLFQKYAIQSLTLKNLERESRKGHASAHLLQVGRVVEGIFRSLNNLLERFNRSYWFYLLPSTRRYLSIGYYMIPFALLTSPLLLTALRGYIRLQAESHEDRGARAEVEQDDRSRDLRQQRPDMRAVTSAPLEHGIPFWFFAHLMGLILLSLPFLVQRHTTSFLSAGSSPRSLAYGSIVSFSFLPILSPIFASSAQNKLSQQVIVLLNTALLLSSISLINISLALSLSLVYSPVLSIVCQPSPVSSRLRSGVHKLLLLLVHPVSINFLCLFFLSLHLHPELGIQHNFLQALHSQKAAILSYIEDWYIYGHWLYLLSSVFLFPVWLQAWHSTT